MSVATNLTFLLLPLLCHRAWSASSPATINLSLGKVIGTVQTFQGHSVERFLGIPFAQPPINELRYRRPLPLTRPYGQISATEWPNSCPQSSAYVHLLNYQSNVFSDDCLYLNIWTPERSQKSLKPVLVYIYGGGFYMGSSSEEILDALPLSALGDILVVTMNYRVGALGFLTDGTDEMPGNIALHDQVLALEWVQDNIASFGGDPKRVTISGESAGSISVGIHLLSPLSQALFRNAILMSGSPLNPLMVESRMTALKRSKKFAKSVDCLINDVINYKLSRESIMCLRKLDTKKLLDKQSESMSFNPLFGDDLLPQSPSQLFAKKLYKTNASIMVGTVTYEGSIVEMDMSRYDELRPLLSDGTKEQWKAALVQKIEQLPNPPVNGSSEGIASFYYDSAKDDPTTSRKIFANAVADYYLACPTFELGLQMAKENSVFSYFFSYKSVSRGSRNGYNLMCEPEDEVCHATELQFLFGMPFLKDAFNDDDRKTSREMIDIWSSFVRNDQTSWKPFYRASNLVVPMTYEINPNARNRLTNDHKLLTCRLWEPYNI